jgi:hypothetical protein
MNVYDELCNFALGHRSCGRIQVHVEPATQRRYRVLLSCSCGNELRRSVTQEDASADLLDSEHLLFPKGTPRATRRRSPRHGVAPSRVRRPSASRPLGLGVDHGAVVAAPSLS